MEKFICHNQAFCILCFCCFCCFCYYVCLPVNCLSSFSSSTPNTSVHYLCPPKQSLALLQFKHAIPVTSLISQSYINNSFPKTNSWKEGSDCCSWDGVTCDEITGNVIGLDLDCSWLRGTIEDNNSLFQLSHLQWLNLAYNNFGSSKISPKFGRLTELTQLNLSGSSFHHSVPSELSLLSKLILLDLSLNSHSLSMDQQTFESLVLNLTRLSVLKLQFMDLPLVKPYSLLNLSLSMTVLDLGYTGIHGYFPKEILHLPNLQEVYLFSNEGLAGSLPKSNWSHHLRVLDLGFCDFNGEIPHSIANLKFLEILKLEENSLIGELPSLSKLQRITFINLQGNRLTGQIPEIFNNFSLSFSGNLPLSYNVNVFSHSTTLVLSENSLDGKIPSWLFTLSSLEYVDLSSNKLTGPIEKFNSGLAKSLQKVYLQDNEIQGSIPSFFFELVNLTTLDISSNNLSGTVNFDRLSKLKNLEELYLSNNYQLSFSFTSNMNFSLSNLLYLNLSSCNVSEFPMLFRTSKKLQSLDLSNSRIHGRILKTESEGWESLTDLDLSNNFLTYIEHHPWKNIRRLYLQNNKIQGSILVPPISTEVFLFSSNKLLGQIPPSICILRSLQYICLSDNNLSGVLPPCLGIFSTNLVMLHLQKNNLQGGILDTFVNGSRLRSLDLSNNNLEGRLPRSLANCSQLEVVNVGNNMISDTFPCWLGTLSKLRVLILRSNRFYGLLCDSKTISSFDNLQIIDLAGNEFTGFLSREFFLHLEKMMDAVKVIYEDQFMGGSYYYESVNVTMKGGEYKIDRILNIFTSIDLSRNRFQGEIPEVLGNFKSLVVLNLSHNSLTGNIPVSLANLTALESLDLSSNKLDGKIPDQLVSVTTLSALNLSYNCLSGLIPQGNQFNTFENDSFIGNEGLCGKPLSVKCDNDGATMRPPPSSVSNEEDGIARGFDWKFAMMGYASGVVIGMSIGYIVFSTGKPQCLVRMVEERLIKRVRRSRPKRGRTKK